MEKDKNIKVDKKIILYALIALVALIIVIIIFVSRLKKIGEPIDKKDPSYAVESNISKTEEEKEERANRYARNESIENRGLDNLPKLEDINYSRYAKIQFAKPNKQEDIAIFKIKDYDGEIKVKLFNNLAPNTVKEFEDAIQKGYFLNKPIAIETFADLIIPARDEGGNGIFKTGNEEEINYSLVPYKGALVQRVLDYEKQGAGRSFSVIMDNMFDNNVNITRKMALNYTIKKELKNRGGRLENTYLKSIIFGQIYEGMDVAEKILKDHLEGNNRTADGQKEVIIQDVQLIIAENNITNNNSTNNIVSSKNEN